MKKLVHVPFAFALLLPLLVTGCGDDADTLEASKPEAGATKPPSTTKLARPALPRPPSGGLPADLRPPR